MAWMGQMPLGEAPVIWATEMYREFRIQVRSPHQQDLEVPMTRGIEK